MRWHHRLNLQADGDGCSSLIKMKQLAFGSFFCLFTIYFFLESICYIAYHIMHFDINIMRSSMSLYTLYNLCFFFRLHGVSIFIFIFCEVVSACAHLQNSLFLMGQVSLELVMMKCPGCGLGIEKCDGVGSLQWSISAF